MKPDIETLSSKTMYENRWMKVREDEIRRSDGTVGIYGVVQKPDYAVIAPVSNTTIYLVEQYRYPVGGRYWEFPQGSWEMNDKAKLKDVAKGELKEEVGVIAGEISEVGHMFQACGYSNQGFKLFIASDLTYVGRTTEVEEQDLISREFDIDHVAQMIVSGEIKDVTTIASFGLLKMKGLI